MLHVTRLLVIVRFLKDRLQSLYDTYRISQPNLCTVETDSTIARRWTTGDQCSTAQRNVTSNSRYCWTTRDSSTGELSAALTEGQRPHLRNKELVRQTTYDQKNIRQIVWKRDQTVQSHMSTAPPSGNQDSSTFPATQSAFTSIVMQSAAAESVTIHHRGKDKALQVFKASCSKITSSLVKVRYPDQRWPLQQQGPDPDQQLRGTTSRFSRAEHCT